MSVPLILAIISDGIRLHEVNVAYGDSQGVSRIRRRHFDKPKNRFYHCLHLPLLGPAVTDDSLLDLQGAILIDRGPTVFSCQDRRPTYMTLSNQTPDVLFRRKYPQ